jgi:hypothetical protein
MNVHCGDGCCAQPPACLWTMHCRLNCNDLRLTARLHVEQPPRPLPRRATVPPEAQTKGIIEQQAVKHMLHACSRPLPHTTCRPGGAAWRASVEQSILVSKVVLQQRRAVLEPAPCIHHAV